MGERDAARAEVQSSWLSGRDPPPQSRSARRMAILSDIASRLLACEDPGGEVLPALFDGIHLDVGVDVAFAYRADPLGKALLLTGVAPADHAPSTAPIDRVAYGEGVVGQVAATHQPIHLSNVQDSSDPRLAALRAAGHHAFAAEPILRGKRLLGVLAFASQGRACFDPDDHLFFQAVARNMGLALDRAERVAELAECNRELQHRAKNMLSMVHAVAMLSARSSRSVDDYTARLGERLIALGKTQDLLAAEHSQRAPLRDLICIELEPFDLPGRLRLRGPRVLLDSSLAVFVGMAIHELTTNAVKYGALSLPTGKVSAEWHIDASGQSRRLCLHWVERGGPPVVEPARLGFGARMLDHGLGNQIRATRHFHAGGLEAFLDIALD